MKGMRLLCVVFMHFLSTLHWRKYLATDLDIEREEYGMGVRDHVSSKESFPTQ